MLPRYKGFCELVRHLAAAGFTHVLDLTLVYIGDDGRTPVPSAQLGTSALAKLATGTFPVRRIFFLRRPPAAPAPCDVHALDNGLT